MPMELARNGPIVCILTSNLVSIALPRGLERRTLRCKRHRTENIIHKAEDLRSGLLGLVKRENEGGACSTKAETEIGKTRKL